MQNSGVRTIKKRDGRIVLYDEQKIANAILKAFSACGQEDALAAARIANEVSAALKQKPSDNGCYSIEEIQDEVENALMRGGYAEVAKRYILYRAQRTNVRESNTALMKAFDEITNADARNSNLKRDNANVDGNTAMGSMLQIGSAAAKAYNAAHLLKKEHMDAHTRGDIHIHDFDFYSLTTTCCQIDIDALFQGGFSTGHGFLREPKDIQSYAALACIAIQSNQNDQHGGQSIPNFDYALAKGVAKTYRRLLRENLRKSLEILDSSKEWVLNSDKNGNIDIAYKNACEAFGKEPNIGDIESFKPHIVNALKAETSEENANKSVEFSIKNTLPETNRRTFQSMEALVHNLNSMHSRAGAQTPFSSINYGTDTSEEGRMIIKNLLLATEDGLGHGETPIFPIQIFKLKKGINYDPQDPNYDLFEMACHCSAKRLFPNFTNLDAPFNAKYYVDGHPETEVVTMGCRTRVMGNVYDPERQTAFGRGNLSFTSINLPRMAILAKGDEELFYKNLDNVMNIAANQLFDRFEIQAKKHVRNFPFLMGQGIWMDSDKLGPDDEIREVLKHGTLSIGFIGLAETLVALYGHHHGESDEMQQKGLEIISYMNDFCVRKSKATGMNVTLLATPAEGLSGRFLAKDRERFGVIEGVTSHNFYTNSFHIPVYYNMSAYDKIQKEAPYHALTPAGHITYVELDGDTADNLEAFIGIVRAMHDAGVGYGSINHPVDRDPVCGYIGIIKDECPRCGRREGESIPPEKLSELRRQYPQIIEFIGSE